MVGIEASQDAMQSVIHPLVLAEIAISAPSQPPNQIEAPAIGQNLTHILPVIGIYQHGDGEDPSKYWMRVIDLCYPTRSLESKPL